MKSLRIALLAVAILGSTSAVGGELPFIERLEFSTLPVGERLTVHGSNLDQNGQVQVCGLEALVVPIQGINTIEMDAYVPENTPYGSCEVTATTAAGISNAVMLEVTPRVPSGRLLWRFTLNEQTAIHRPAIGPDDTVYARSAAGDLVALTPHGELLWLRLLGPNWTSQVDVGPDGTIYTADGWPEIYAVNPDGSIKWSYRDTLSQGVLAGPNVGPDGNLYVVTDFGSNGLFSLDPDGNVRWVFEGSDYQTFAQDGQEIVFSNNQLFFCQDAKFDSFDFGGDHIFRQFTNTSDSADSPQPAVRPDGTSYIEEWGRLRSHDPSGGLNWIAFDVGGNYLRDPDIGPDGSIYVYRNVFNTLHALNPDGSERWSYRHPESTLSAVVNPAGDKLLMGGAGIGLVPSFILALDTAGNPLWQQDLPFEEYEFYTIVITPQARPRFSNDGSVVYVMALGPAGYPGHSYLYAVQVEPIVALDHALAGSKGEPVLSATGSLTPGSPLSVSLSGALPGANAYLIAGRSAAGTPLAGGVMLPSRDVVMPLTVDASGDLDIDLTWPAGIPSSSTAYLQVWIEDPEAPQGLAASNALSLITP